jgi:hypothetical protein
VPSGAMDNSLAGLAAEPEDVSSPASFEHSVGAVAVAIGVNVSQRDGGDVFAASTSRSTSARAAA